MIGALLLAIFSIGVATLAVGVMIFRSLRRSEHLGEHRYELLQDQHDRLELLHEERRALIEELERESRERRRLMESLEGPQPAEDPEQERGRRTENARRAQQQEEKRLRDGTGATTLARSEILQLPRVEHAPLANLCHAERPGPVRIRLGPGTR